MWEGIVLVREMIHWSIVRWGLRGLRAVGGCGAVGVGDEGQCGIARRYGRLRVMEKWERRR